jgi:hypothetical protein
MEQENCMKLDIFKATKIIQYSRVISCVNLKQKCNVSDAFSVSTIREWVSSSDDGDAEVLEALDFCVEMTCLAA